MIEAILVVGLASLYITYTVRYLEGPFGIYHWIMSKFGIHWMPMLDSDGNFTGYVEHTFRAPGKENFLQKLASCFWCFTTWICLAVTIVYVTLSSLNFGQGVFVWLASAGLSGWLFERIPDGTSG
jgi:hypothetical protein